MAIIAVIYVRLYFVSLFDNINKAKYKQVLQNVLGKGRACKGTLDTARCKRKDINKNVK
jgi:acyl-ACP thioesterase